MHCAKFLKSFGDRGKKLRSIHPHKLSPSLNRVGQWTEQVEDGRKTQGFPYRHDVFSCGVMVGGKTETHTKLIETSGLHFERGLDVDSQSLKKLR